MSEYKPSVNLNRELRVLHTFACDKINAVVAGVIFEAPPEEFKDRAAFFVSLVEDTKKKETAVRLIAEVSKLDPTRGAILEVCIQFAELIESLADEDKT